MPIGPMPDADQRLREVEAAVSWTKEHVARVMGKSVVEIRALADKNKEGVALPDGVKVEPVDIDGVPGTWTTAPNADPSRVVLYFHGGGFAMGSLKTHARLAADISVASGARVLLVAYRLAPEHPFPAGLDDCFASYKWLLSQGVPANKVVFGGDSAGGGLVISTLVMARDAGLPMPVCAACLSPWVNLGCDGETLETKRNIDPLGTPDSFWKFVAAYIKDVDPRTPLASPIYADLKGLPPLLIQVGTREFLLDDSWRLDEAARAAGVEVTFEEWPEMIHNWQLLPHMLTDGQRANDRIGEYFRERLDAA